MMGGDLTVASQPGKGSTFTVTLPAQVQQTVPEQGDTASFKRAASAAPGAQTVLVIDDDPAARDLIERALSREGFQVACAGDGKSGLDLILKVEPDVAIVDVGLPIIDGYEVATQVRLRLGRDRPRLVAMTGFGQEADRRKARDAGFDTHLVKPAPMEAIIEVLRPPSRAVSELEPQSTS